MGKTFKRSIPLVLVLWLLSGCDAFRQVEPPEVDLTDILPGDIPPVGKAIRLDVNGDGTKEWLVFYHIDLIVDNPDGSPISAALYRPVPEDDKRLPPDLIPALIWLPSQGYVCLYTCVAAMEDVISGNPAGKELVIRDMRGQTTVGVAIFSWNPKLITNRGTQSPVPGGFVPLGHFRADSITLGLDRVALIRKHQDRSGLAASETFEAVAGHYYQRDVRHVDDPPSLLRPPKEAKIIFADGPPEDPIAVKVPEKLVMAFYLNYRDVTKIQPYFTPEAWTRLGQNCAGGVCGCTSPRPDVSQAMVKQIAYEGELRETVKVLVDVICVKNNNQRDPKTSVTWILQRQEDTTWRLLDAVPGGQQ